MCELSILKDKSFSLPGTQLTLKVLKTDDVSERYVGWLNDYDIVKFTEQHYVKHSKKNIIDFVEEMYLSEANFLFGIYFDHEHIGNIKLGPIGFDHNVSEISYFIAEKKHLRKGVGTEVVGAVVRIAFNDIGLDKVTAGTHANNIGSIKVLKKNGFIEEGRRYKQLLFEGQRIDSLIFGKVREDHV